MDDDHKPSNNWAGFINDPYADVLFNVMQDIEKILNEINASGLSDKELEKIKLLDIKNYLIEEKGFIENLINDYDIEGFKPQDANDEDFKPYDSVTARNLEKQYYPRLIDYYHQVKRRLTKNIKKENKKMEGFEMKKEILDLFILVEKQIENKGLSEEDLEKQGLLEFYNSLKANHSFVEEHVSEDDIEKLTTYKNWLEQNSENLTTWGFEVPEMEEEIEEDEEIDEETKTTKSNGSVKSKVVPIVALGLAGALVIGTAFAAWNINERQKALNEYAAELQSQQEAIEAQVEEEVTPEITPEVIEEEITPIVTEEPAEEITEPEEVVEEVVEEPVEEAAPIYYVDLDNEEALYQYAEQLSSQLGENSLLTTDEIVDAIRLANIDDINNDGLFSSRDQLYNSTYAIGDITTALGTDSIIRRNPETDIYLSEDQLKDIIACVTNNEVSIDSFESACTDKGYDIYCVAETCVRNMYDNNGDDMNYAKILNDLVARTVLSFSVVENAPLQTYYSILGIYNANGARVDELTAGQLLGPIYGNYNPDTAMYGTTEADVKIDGTYGYICVEELRDTTYVGSEDCIFYTLIADDEVINQNGLSR